MYRHAGLILGGTAVIEEESQKSKRKETLGPENKPNKAIKFTVKARPDMFTKLNRTCLAEKIFLGLWG